MATASFHVHVGPTPPHPTLRPSGSSVTCFLKRAEAKAHLAAKCSERLGTGCNRQNAGPKAVQVLVPRTWDYVTLCGKRILQVRLRISRWADHPGLLSGSHGITGSL